MKLELVLIGAPVHGQFVLGVQTHAQHESWEIHWCSFSFVLLTAPQLWQNMH